MRFFLEHPSFVNPPMFESASNKQMIGCGGHTPKTWDELRSIFVSRTESAEAKKEIAAACAHG
jgi:hypothetical protein